jgi:IS5 family transposase
MALHGNPYNRHTLEDALLQVERVTVNPTHAFVDMGSRGHGYEVSVQVHVNKRRVRQTARSLWRWMKRRAAIEPSIGHLKSEHRMDRNRLKVTCGDRIKAILNAAGMDLWKLQRFAASFCADCFCDSFFVKKHQYTELPHDLVFPRSSK